VSPEDKLMRCVSGPKQRKFVREKLSTNIS
jgi:hypothetical protein